MKIVVIGGTGLIGSKVVARLRELGHEAVVAAPSTGIDILSGAGLDEAMAGAEVVVDLANSPSFEDAAVLSFFQTAGRNILTAEARAGVRHHLALSVVGTDKLSASGYFRGKIAQEALIRGSAVPYTIVHSTQFFEFLPGIVQSASVGDQVHLSPALVQPIASDDVADAVTRLALQPPANGIVEIAGPEREPLSGLARRFMAASGDARVVVSDENALYFGARLQTDTLVPAGAAWQGAIGFERWFAQTGSTRKATGG
ncbi:SDR family oxidoreductase [Lysobacter silvisoli]|uniref:NAD-dependent epimerase/dehydratase family protein n=1 Tax=Lysobacter silvisoli TaxID=2293254 RepID=A0A371K0B7_9GAMM|nr:SDR family oxidoreductase [Lysobacter silvisoli]RDZ27302.1 NAD-dependent epimerase/dehydratase family protein [Lysobacter silvisoli]